MASKSRGTMLTCTLQALTTRMTSSASVPSACTGATTTRSTSSGASWLRTFATMSPKLAALNQASVSAISM